MNQARKRLTKVLDIMEPATRSLPAHIGEGVALNKDKKVLTRAQEDNAWYYYFSINNGEKFAIMSARNDLPELLAIGNGTPDKNDPSALVPDTSLWNINNIDIIATVDSSWIAENDTIIYQRSEPFYYFPYRHLCPVKWDQSHPFNKYVKFDSILNNKPTAGCLATATAHFMSGAKCRPSHYKQVSFDWNTWIKYPTVDSLYNHPEVLDSIAKLLIYLGDKENLNMDYGVNHSYTSLAYPSDIPKTLVNFGFFYGGNLVPFTEEAVINEFKRGYPVIINGYTSLGGSGHSWVLHGLMVSETIVTVYNRKEAIDCYTEKVYYFDVNWGWAAQGDGYYLSTGFNSLVPPDFNPDGNPVNRPTNPDKPWGANFDGYKSILTGVKKTATEQ